MRPLRAMVGDGMEMGVKKECINAKATSKTCHGTTSACRKKRVRCVKEEDRTDGRARVVHEGKLGRTEMEAERNGRPSHRPKHYTSSSFKRRLGMPLEMGNLRPVSGQTNHPSSTWTSNSA